MTDVPINHIVLDAAGKARIKGRGFKVRVLIEFIQAGITMEELVADYDLTRAQIHAALSYYYDHQGEFDAEIARLKALVEQHRPEAEARRRDLLEPARAKGLIRTEGDEG
jgi:uncharacterized protein (DUF433 family)